MNPQQIPNYQGAPYGATFDNPMPNQYYGDGMPQRVEEGQSPQSPSSDGLSPGDPLRGPPSKRLAVGGDESVYDALLLLPAISRIQTGKATDRPARLALMLVLLNMLLQIGVVGVINTYDHIYRSSEMQQLLLPGDVPDYGDHALSSSDKAFTRTFKRSERNVQKRLVMPNEREEIESVESIQPLCSRGDDGMLTCTPHSVSYVNDWNSLDTDGNGIWTIEEAREDAANLRAMHKGVSPETIFNNMINGLRMSKEFAEGRNRTFYLTPDIEAERAIPKAYFNFWMGDAMMCSLFDSNSCEGAAKAGLFEAALKPGRISAHAKAIYDLDSALEYCYRMLEPGGGCETLLPTDFKGNREQRWGRCGKRMLKDGGKYTNPWSPDQSVHVLTATYSNLSDYTRATSHLYQLFLCLIIMLWLLALMNEFRELIMWAEFLIVFPGIEPGGPGGVAIEAETEDEDEANVKGYKIRGISRGHRAVLTVVYIMRLLVATMLLLLGTRFLLVETSYLNLVLNSLALTFILEIDSILYTLIDKTTQSQMKHCKPLAFRTRLPHKGILGYFLKKECWGLFLIPCTAVCLVLYFTHRDKLPLLQALTCACVQEGSKCSDSMHNQEGWWKNYWTHTLPAAMHQIEALRTAAFPALVAPP